jgi:hypothetical protein
MMTILVDEPLPLAVTWVGIITASATVLTALGGLVLAVSVLVPILRNSKVTVAKIDEVHVMVNQQRTDAQRYQAALVKALHEAGVKVPEDQSILPMSEGSPDEAVLGLEKFPQPG